MPSLKISVLVTLALCLALPLRAQNPGAAYSAEQLDELLGPIALYPDPLLAVMLPASTAPSDIAQAANYLAANGAPGAIDAQPWDASVKALAHYPEVVQWMNANLDWTQALGAAFAQQPADVMKSVQQLRARARVAGTLLDTRQQHVELAGDDIRIVPAEANTIYVPQYDPAIVYETPVGYSGPFLSFGIGFPVGGWLSYQCDWDDYGIWVGPWSPGWGYRREWRHPPAGGNRFHAWRPDPRHSREIVRAYYRPEGRLPRAGFVPGFRAQTPRPGEGRSRPNEEHGFVNNRAPNVRPAVPVQDFRGRGVAAPHTPSPAPRSPLFGGYGRGTTTRDSSGRGQASRAAPVRAIPANHAAPPQRSQPAPPPRSQPAPRAPAPPPEHKKERP